MQTAQDIYSNAVLTLPPSERLQLARLILDGLSASAASLDYSDHWSDEDLKDLTAFSADCLSKALDQE